ncbi:hypothetical protein ICE_05624 [Bacillus cereus BAG1X1-2]|nr:hypothetical protein ICE_05624 [Bacillus cereus BAG1X1-2]
MIEYDSENLTAKFIYKKQQDLLKMNYHFWEELAKDSL